LAQIARSLNLTDSQKQQAKAIFQQQRQTAQPVRQQLQQNRQALADAVKAGKANTDIQQLAAQQGTLLGQMVAIRTQAWSQFYNLLTPDQRTQLDQQSGQKH
jgi:Spy/CpxP family protein refolding chaperone